MELKLIHIGILRRCYRSFNRTNMELKHRFVRKFYLLQVTFNRTNMELKLILN